MKLLLLLLFLPLHANALWDWREISWYCHCTKCCGKYSGLNRTASGTRPTVNRTIAENRLPFGTKVWMMGNWFTVEDRLSGQYSHRIDVYVPSHSLARRNGITKTWVWVEK